MAGFSLTGSVGFLLLAYCAYIYGYGVIEHILGFFIVMLPAGILGAGLGALLGLLFWIFIDKFIVHPLEMISKLFHDGCDFLIKGIAVKSKRAFRELRARFSKEKSDKFPLSLDNGGDFWSDFYCHSPNVFFGEGNLAQRHYQSDLVIQAFPKRLIKKGIYRKSKPWYDSIPLALNSPSARKIAKSIEALKRIKPRGKNKGISERARRLEKETAVIEVDMPSHFLLYGRDVFNQAYYQVTHVGKGSRTIYVPMMFMEDVEDLSYIATILHHDQMEIEDFSKFLERGEIVTNKVVEDAHAKAMKVDPFGVYRRISIRCRRMMAVSDMFTVAVVRKQREQARREIAKEEKRLQDMEMLHSVSNKEALEPRIILDRLSRLHILMACLYDFEDSRDKAVKHYGLAIESLKGIEENPDIDTGWLPMQINFRIVYILARQKMLSRLRREMVFLSRLEIGREASESEQESFRTLMEYGFYSVRHEVIGILKKHLSNTILNRASGTEYARILEAIKFIKRCKYFPNKGKDGQNKPLDNGGLKLSHQYEAMICHSINVFVRDLSSTTAFRNGKVTISREGLTGKITQDLKYLHQGLKPLVKFIGLSIKSVNEGGQKIKIRGYHLDNPALCFLLPINPVCEIDIAQVQPLTENDLPDELNALLRDYQDYYFGESLVVTFSNQSLDNGGTSFPGTDNARIKVLILCNQNKERSPLAAAMLRNNLPEDLKGKVEIASAAIYDIAPDPTIDMYTEKDPILSRHSPRCHTDADIKEAKIIFVMTARQKETILRLYPGCEDKVRLFLEEGDLNTCMQDHPSTSELFLPSAIPYKHLRRQIEENLNSVFRSVRKVVSENWKQDDTARKAINDGVVFININDLIESPLRFTHRPSPGKQIKGTLGSGSSSHPEPGCQFPEVIINNAASTRIFKNELINEMILGGYRPDILNFSLDDAVDEEKSLIFNYGVIEVVVFNVKIEFWKGMKVFSLIRNKKVIGHGASIYYASEKETKFRFGIHGGRNARADRQYRGMGLGSMVFPVLLDILANQKIYGDKMVGFLEVWQTFADWFSEDTIRGMESIVRIAKRYGFSGGRISVYDLRVGLDFRKHSLIDKSLDNGGKKKPIEAGVTLSGINKAMPVEVILEDFEKGVQELLEHPTVESVSVESIYCYYKEKIEKSVITAYLVDRGFNKIDKDLYSLPENTVSARQPSLDNGGQENFLHSVNVWDISDSDRKLIRLCLKFFFKRGVYFETHLDDVEQEVFCAFIEARKNNRGISEDELRKLSWRTITAILRGEKSRRQLKNDMYHKKTRVVYENSFAGRLRELMDKNDLMPRDIMRIIGVGKSTLWFWLKGKTMPSRENTLKLAKYFNVTVWYFLSGMEKEEFMVQQVSPEDKTEYGNLVARKIKLLMYEKNLTMDELAKKVGVTKAAVSVWMKGRVLRLPLKRKRKIAKAFGEKTTDIFGKHRRIKKSNSQSSLDNGGKMTVRELFARNEKLAGVTSPALRHFGFGEGYASGQGAVEKTEEWLRTQEAQAVGWNPEALHNFIAVVTEIEKNAANCINEDVSRVEFPRIILDDFQGGAAAYDEELDALVIPLTPPLKAKLTIADIAEAINEEIAHRIFALGFPFAIQSQGQKEFFVACGLKDKEERSHKYLTMRLSIEEQSKLVRIMKAFYDLPDYFYEEVLVDKLQAYFFPDFLKEARRSINSRNSYFAAPQAVDDHSSLGDLGFFAYFVLMGELTGDLEYTKKVTDNAKELILRRQSGRNKDDFQLEIEELSDEPREYTADEPEFFDSLVDAFRIVFNAVNLKAEINQSLDNGGFFSYRIDTNRLRQNNERSFFPYPHAEVPNSKRSQFLLFRGWRAIGFLGGVQCFGTQARLAGTFAAAAGILDKEEQFIRPDTRAPPKKSYKTDDTRRRLSAEIFLSAFDNGGQNNILGKDEAKEKRHRFSRFIKGFILGFAESKEEITEIDIRQIGYLYWTIEHGDLDMITVFESVIPIAPYRSREDSSTLTEIEDFDGNIIAQFNNHEVIPQQVNDFLRWINLPQRVY
ncbi:MAG: helix-turn-helix domain-containing protein, partial [Candidatus Omnitrophica bacterium]|nr:helix-turn-helix domain-containing protein [Candidatus Omnitrophota bacterium]